MKTIRFLRFLGITCLLAFSFGCATTYRDEFLKQAKEKNWTKEEQLAAYYASFRVYFAKPANDGKFTVLYSRLPKSEVTKQLGKYLADLSGFLDYRDEEADRYMKAFGLREHFEWEEKLFKVVKARARAAELQDTFKEMIGENSSMPGMAGEGEDLSHGYSEYIFRNGNLRDLFPFKSTVIEEAKKNGLLKQVEHFSMERYQEFHHKEPDPNAPDDRNKFVWRSKKIALEITKYKIMTEGVRPENNYGNYEEVYRVLDGKKESAPAVQMFLDESGSFGVAVIDVDEERKGSGFGLPDFVERLPENDVASEAMFARLFPEEEKYKRIEPKRPPIRVEIARVGERANVWEKATDPKGWTVPLTYQQKPLHDNYNVRIKFKMPDVKESESGHPHHLFQIEYIEKEWNSGASSFEWGVGKVVEYYRPKPPYDQPVLGARVMLEESPKKLQLVVPDGTEKVGFITPLSNIFVEDRPEQIAYTVGDERWLIRDEDHDGIYEKRKKISPKLTHEIGTYPQAMDVEREDHDSNHR